MEFTKFHYVVTVAEMRSFSRAAEKLFISQPALTKSIAKLESELGVKLFDRSATPLQLTYAGERYIEGMKSVMAMKHQLDKELEDISNMRKGRLIVGIPYTRSNRWIPMILPSFFENCPGIDLKVEEGTASSLEQGLLHENIDLVVVTSLPFGVAGLEYEVFHEEELMVLCARKHPMFAGIDFSRVDRRPDTLHYIRPERLDDQPYISATPEQGLYRAASQLFERFNLHPRAIVEVANTSTARTLASEGLGFCITPTHSAYAQKLKGHEVMFCTITDPPMTRSIIAAYKKGVPLSGAARRFIEITRQVSRRKDLHVPSFEVVHDLEP
ncbi:MAG TPA: LysR family transcriptional regulator [Clostridia bacterium]|nr:LysR family transcriptional regulator [Clostridia bacterium]